MFTEFVSLTFNWQYRLFATQAAQTASVFRLTCRCRYSLLKFLEL